MVDPLGAFSAAVSGLGVVRDLIRTNFDAKVDAASKLRVMEAVDKLGEAQSAMYELREELFRLQDQVRELKRSKDDREEFEARLADDYALVRTSGGAMVYRFLGEPAHYVCPNCVNLRRFEVLQGPVNRWAGTYRCTATGCGASFDVDQPQEMPRLPNHNPYGP